MEKVHAYKSHIELVQRDRSLEAVLQGENLFTNDQAILFIQTDGVDQAKWALPRTGDLRDPKKTSNIVRRGSLLNLAHGLNFITSSRKLSRAVCFVT